MVWRCIGKITWLPTEGYLVLNYAKFERFLDINKFAVWLLDARHVGIFLIFNKIGLTQKSLVNNSILLNGRL